MPSPDRRSWLDRAVGACLTILVGATALYIAVQLVEAVRTALIVIGLVALLSTAGVAYWRARNRGW